MAYISKKDYMRFKTIKTCACVAAVAVIAGAVVLRANSGNTDTIGKESNTAETTSVNVVEEYPVTEAAIEEVSEYIAEPVYTEPVYTEPTYTEPVESEEEVPEETEFAYEDGYVYYYDDPIIFENIPALVDDEAAYEEY
jgi:hypothetical protein